MSAAAPLAHVAALRSAPAELPPEGASFEQMFDTYAPFVWRVLRRLGVRGPDIEDVCQEVFLVVHRRLPEFRRRSSFRTWIYGISTNLAFPR